MAIGWASTGELSGNGSVAVKQGKDVTAVGTLLPLDAKNMSTILGSFNERKIKVRQAVLSKYSNEPGAG